MACGELLTFPLIARPDEAVLFRTATGPITMAQLNTAAHRLAEALPARRYLLNLCRSRSGFALATLAATLRGQISIAPGEGPPERLRAIAARFADASSLADDRATASPLAAHRCLPPWPQAVAVKAAANPAAQIVAIVFTSGSTGEPLAYRKSWGELVRRSRAAATQFALCPAHPVAIVGTVPPAHMYGFETTVLLPLHAGASSWCGPTFYPDDLRRALIACPAPRMLVTTPLHLHALLRHNLDLPPLARIVSATAPLDAGIAAAAEARFGAPVEEIFGATEIGSIASRRPTHTPLWRLYPGIRISIADTPMVSRPGGEPCPLADAIEMHGTEHFRLLGRGGDVIKLAGRRASLAGLNRILNEIEGVEDGVFLAPAESMMDDAAQPVARMQALVVAPARSPAEILAALRTRIDPVFLPRRLVRVAALPRDALGKLPRQALLALLDDG
jgi:acyl-coenzyme A synthetase/AMP-(fatty) acid ligase